MQKKTISWKLLHERVNICVKKKKKGKVFYHFAQIFLHAPLLFGRHILYKIV